MTLASVYFSVILSVLMLVLGWYGRDWVELSRAARARSRLKKKHEILGSDARRLLLAYYMQRGEGDSLFTLGTGKKAPFLTKPTWHGASLTGRAIEFAETNDAVDVPVNKAAIRARRTAGQKVWDGPVVCLSGIYETADRIVLNVSYGTYYQYLTQADCLISECVKKATVTGPLPFRDRLAANLHQLSAGELGAQLVGMGIVLVLNLDGMPRVLLQRRSPYVGIAADTWTVVPTFVCEPDYLKFGDPRLDSGRVALHSFLVEFYEELCDCQELIQDSRHLAPDWFYSESPIKEIVERLASGGMTFGITGLGFDAYTGELHIAGLAHVTDEELAKGIFNRIKHNWEMKDVRLLDIHSDELHAMVDSPDFYPTGAFDLQCAIETLRSGVSGGRGPAEAGGDSGKDERQV